MEMSINFQFSLIVFLSTAFTNRWYNFDKSKDIDYLERPVYGLADREIIVMLLPETVVSKQESVHYFYNLDPNHTTLGRDMNKRHLSIKDTCFDRVLILSCIIRTPKTFFVVSVCPLSNVHVRPLTQHTPFTNNPDYNYYYFSHFSLQVCRYICDPGQRNDYYVWHTFAIKENRYSLL